MITEQDITQRVTEELNLAHLSAEEQDQVLETLGKALQTRVVLALVQEIPAQEHEQLRELIEAGKEGEVRTLIEARVPNANEIVERELTEGLAAYKQALTQESADA